jgi:hypothetical protein
MKMKIKIKIKMNNEHTCSLSSCLLSLCLQSTQTPSLILLVADKGLISQAGQTSSGKAGKAAASFLMDSRLINTGRLRGIKGLRSETT